jgi:hypothetical protein
MPIKIRTKRRKKRPFREDLVLLRHASTGQGYLSDAASILLSQRPISLFNHASLSSLSISKTWPLGSPQTGLIYLTLNFVSVHSAGCAFTKQVKLGQKCEEVFETVGLEEQGPMIALLLILTTNYSIPLNLTALPVLSLL